MMKRKILLIKLKRLLGKEPIEFAYLFGSQATAEASRFSDIDLAVYFKKGATKNILGNKISLSVKLEDELGKEVDITYLNKLDLIPPHLGYDIVKEGQLVLEKRPKLRQKIEKKLLKKYKEKAPIVEKHWQRMLSRIRAMEI